MASDRSEQPYDYAEPRWGAEREAQRLGRPLTRMDEALARGYVEGDDDRG